MSVEHEIVNYLNDPEDMWVNDGSHVLSFDPCDSDTWEEVGESETQSDEPKIPPSPGMYPLPEVSISESDDNDVPVQTNADGCVITTDLNHLKAVIQTRVGYDGEIQLSKFLKKWPGLIILPLSCLPYIRKPATHHTSDPQVLLYMPPPGSEEISGYPNFIEADFYLRQVN